MNISLSVKKLQERIYSSAIKAGRNSEEIKIIAASKTVELLRIIEAANAGIMIFGENRVQEAQKKISYFKIQFTPPIPPLNKGGIGGVEWHLIGHLQKNKAKYAVRLFELIHTIDSVELAEEVNRQAEKTGKIQRVLVQVKLSKEDTKHGISEQELPFLIKRINEMSNLKLEGLMTMPPFFEDPEMTRPYFRRLREIRDEINSSRIPHYALQELSMGMSNDFEVAIEEGATMVRIGTALFGKRQTM
jgi:hypothetical protein